MLCLFIFVFSVVCMFSYVNDLLENSFDVGKVLV